MDMRSQARRNQVSRISIKENRAVPYCRMAAISEMRPKSMNYPNLVIILLRSYPVSWNRRCTLFIF